MSKMSRIHRLKRNTYLRDMISEIDFNTSQLVQPLFAVKGLKNKELIKGLENNYRHSADSLMQQVEIDLEAGVRHFLLFAVPDKGDLAGSFDSEIVNRLKTNFGDQIQLWVDTCMCSSTEHGHCCLFHENGEIDIKASLHILAGKSLKLAQAGADGISPSDMMDGRTQAIRSCLSESGFDHIPIMSYSTKFASHLYGPFRFAANSTPQFGDRKQYQLDVRSRRQALEASVRCAQEGADLLMIKPGMTGIDLIAPIVESTKKSVGVYQVSGEYASLVLLAENELVNFDSALLETWYCFKRAGAQFIISYGARKAGQLGIKQI